MLANEDRRMVGTSKTLLFPLNYITSQVLMNLKEKSVKLSVRP